MTDTTDMKLGDYRDGRRAVWVRCPEDEDPREAMRPQRVTGPAPSLQPKRRAAKRDVKGER